MELQFKGAIRITPKEMIRLQDQGVNLRALLMASMHSSKAKITNSGDQSIEFMCKSPDEVILVIGDLKSRVEDLLKPISVSCPDCYSTYLALDIDVILTRVFHQMSNGTWDHISTIEYRGNANVQLRCEDCGRELSPDTISINTILSKIGIIEKG